MTTKVKQLKEKTAEAKQPTEKRAKAEQRRGKTTKAERFEETVELELLKQGRYEEL